MGDTMISPGKTVSFDEKVTVINVERIDASMLGDLFYSAREIRRFRRDHFYELMHQRVEVFPSSQIAQFVGRMRLVRHSHVRSGNIA